MSAVSRVGSCGKSPQCVQEHHSLCHHPLAAAVCVSWKTEQEWSWDLDSDILICDAEVQGSKGITAPKASHYPFLIWHSDYTTPNHTAKEGNILDVNSKFSAK